MRYNIIIVGCGGTGGNFIKELGRFLYRASIKNSCSILLIDGDLVEEHNVSRQPFLPEDVGRKKAAVMAEILQEAFQVTCSYYPEYLNHVYELEKFEKEDYVTILIGCVDNHACRKVQKQLFTKIQTGLFGEIPGPVLDCLDFPYGRAAIYLYSEKIIKYLEFAADNKDIIHNQFAREHERIRRALRIVEQPVAREWVKSHVKKGRYYIIGFYIGEDIEHGITFRNLNWNFFVALYVLEKLLEIADSFFHFYEER